MVSLAARLLIVAWVPTLYAFDAFQRWAGREHLLVRSWFPATQAVIVGTVALGGGQIAARVALSAIAALGVAAGAVVVRRLGGGAAAWIAIGLFAPWLTWSATLYQEGTWLALVLGALALALPAAREGETPGPRALLLADLLAGAAALSRTEGWVFVPLWILWRREPRALRAAWGMALWGALALAGLTEGARPSPVNYADWHGLFERFTWGGWTEDARRLLWMSAQSGGLWVILLGMIGLWRARRQRGAMLILAIGLAQLAVVAGWLAGLEGAISRMEVIPVAVFGLGFPLIWRALPARLLWAGAVVIGGLWIRLAVVDAHNAAEAFHPEMRLAVQIAHCEGCRVALYPREGLGTRDRHDACEILQGLSDLVEGEDFWCSEWGPLPEDITHEAHLEGWRYRIVARLPTG